MVDSYPYLNLLNILNLAASSINKRQLMAIKTTTKWLGPGFLKLKVACAAGIVTIAINTEMEISKINNALLFYSLKTDSALVLFERLDKIKTMFPNISALNVIVLISSIVCFSLIEIK